MVELDIHTIANSFPMMTTKEYSGLVGSMEKDGYDKNFPIVIYEDKILDGRNRYKAAIEVGVEPIYRVFKGILEEAVAESQKLNLKRRNMNKNQLSMTAAKEIVRTRESTVEKKLSIPKSALIHNISVTYIKRAMKILIEDPVLADHVFNGKVTISQAEYKLNEIQRAREPIPEFENDDLKVDESVETTDKESMLELSELKDKNQEISQNLETLQGHYVDIAEELAYYKENCTCNLQYKTGH